MGNATNKNTITNHFCVRRLCSIQVSVFIWELSAVHPNWIKRQKGTKYYVIKIFDKGIKFKKGGESTIYDFKKYLAIKWTRDANKSIQQAN